MDSRGRAGVPESKNKRGKQPCQLGLHNCVVSAFKMFSRVSVAQFHKWCDRVRATRCQRPNKCVLHCYIYTRWLKVPRVSRSRRTVSVAQFHHVVIVYEPHGGNDQINVSCTVRKFTLGWLKVPTVSRSRRTVSMAQFHQ